MTASADVVRTGLVAPLEELGIDLETVEIQKAGRRHVVRIVVDRDGGLDLDLIAQVSQRVSELLDLPPLADELPGPFVLEVTSPGVDRPLTEPRHWRRAITRLVQVTRLDGSELEGRVTTVPDDATAILDTPSGPVALPIADVRRAVVQVEFNRAVPEGGSDDVPEGVPEGEPDDEPDDEDEE